MLSRNTELASISECVHTLAASKKGVELLFMLTKRLLRRLDLEGGLRLGLDLRLRRGSKCL